MKRILLPTDFSANAWNAILTAQKIYARQSCHFLVLNAYQPKLNNLSGFKSSTRTGTVISGLRQSSKKSLHEVLHELRKLFTNERHTFSSVCRKGDLVSIINELVAEYDLDLVVVGNKGSTAAKNIFMGSNTVAVIRKIRNCAVLSVPETYNFQSLKRVVFPTDYTNFYVKGILRLLLEMVIEWKSDLRVFHVAGEFVLTKNQITNKGILGERLKGVEGSFHQVVLVGTVAEAIVNYAEEVKADMICLLHYEHTFLELLTREPLIKKVAFNSGIPILVLPD